MTTTEKLQHGIFATQEGKDVAERIIHYAGYNVPEGEKCMRTIKTTDTALGEICRALGVKHFPPSEFTPCYHVTVFLSDNHWISIEGSPRVAQVNWSEL